MDITSDGSSKFDFQGQKLMLTYKTHVPKAGLIKWLKETTGVEKMRFIRCAHETGTTNEVPYLHTHALIDFGKAWKCRNCRRLDLKGPDGAPLHPNWRPIKTILHWRNCVRYIGKEDSENSDLLEQGPSVTAGVWSCDTLQDALMKYVDKPSDAPGVMALYNAKPREIRNIKRPDKPWHDFAIQIIEGESDKRSIHWFWEEVGNVGKSWLGKWAMATGLAYTVKQAGGARDFATIVAGALDSGWNEKCMIFDLPRRAEEHSIYVPIENCLDGMVTTTKYAGGTKVFNEPVVVVFANFPPNRNGTLSADRWKVYYIPNGVLESGPGVGAQSLGEEGGLNIREPAQEKVGEIVDVTSREGFMRAFPIIEDNIAHVDPNEYAALLDELMRI